MKTENKEAIVIKVSLEELVLEEERCEKKCKRIQKNNEKLMSLFVESSNVSLKTINKHLSNIDFYLNSYLVFYDEESPLSMKHGTRKIDTYLGNYFIRRCVWSTPKAIKSAATSIKMFYKCMFAHGKITEKEYSFLCKTIKDNLTKWQEVCAQYNDPTSDFEFSIFY